MDEIGSGVMSFFSKTKQEATCFGRATDTGSEVQIASDLQFVLKGSQSTFMIFQTPYLAQLSAFGVCVCVRVLEANYTVWGSFKGQPKGNKFSCCAPGS